MIKINYIIKKYFFIQKENLKGLFSMDNIDYGFLLKNIQNLSSETLMKVEGKNICVNILGTCAPILPLLPSNFLEIINSKNKILSIQALNNAKALLDILSKDHRAIFEGIKQINSSLSSKSGKDLDNNDKILKLINLFLNNPLNSGKFLMLIKKHTKFEYFRKITTFKENMLLRVIYFGYLEYLNENELLSKFSTYIEETNSNSSSLKYFRDKIKRGDSHIKIIIKILKKIQDSSEKGLLLGIYANLEEGFDYSMLFLLQELFYLFILENRDTISKFFSSKKEQINIDSLISTYIEMIKKSSKKYGLDFDKQSRELTIIFILFLKS